MRRAKFCRNHALGLEKKPLGASVRVGGGGDTTHGPGFAPAGTDDTSVPGPGDKIGVPNKGLKKLCSLRGVGVLAGLKESARGTRGDGISRIATALPVLAFGLVLLGMFILAVLNRVPKAVDVYSEHWCSCV